MSSTTNRPEAPAAAGTWSVALRLTLWYMASSFAILLVATVSLYLILVGNLHREEDAFLVDKIGVIRDLLRKHPSDLNDLREEVEQTFAPRQYERVYARVLGPDGRVIAESPRMSQRLTPSDFPAPIPLESVSAQGISRVGMAGRPVRILAARAQLGSEENAAAVIQVALDTDLARDLLAGYRRTLLLVLGIGLALCGLAGYWLARTSLGPLRKIAATTQRIGSSNLDERIEVARLPAEISVLALRFNAMLERLGDSFTRLSLFSADLAHELRTPVNNMRLEVEVALSRARSVEEYRETLGSCLEECERLARIIDSMLFIARADDPRTQIHKETVDVKFELERVREYFEAPATEAGVELSVCCAPHTVAELDRMLFQRAVGNLVANGIRHTPRGGRIAIAATREGDQLLVTISDSGAGIAPMDLPHVFDRFYRADRARSTASGNVGLGLAIVRSIVSLHGGTIDAASVVGAGTQMRIRLPAGAAKPSMANVAGSEAQSRD